MGKFWIFQELKIVIIGTFVKPGLPTHFLDIPLFATYKYLN